MRHHATRIDRACTRAGRVPRLCARAAGGEPDSGAQPVRGRQARHRDGGVQGLRPAARPLRRRTGHLYRHGRRRRGRRPGSLPHPAGEHVHRRGDRGRRRGHRGAAERPGVRARRVPPRTRVVGRPRTRASRGRALAGGRLPRSHRLRARRGARRPRPHRRRRGRVRDGRARPGGAAARAAGGGTPGDRRRPDRAAPRGGARAWAPT